MTDLIGINWIATLVAAIVPMFIGFIWYHGKTFGNRWMKETGLDPAKLASGNMAIICTQLFPCICYELYSDTPMGYLWNTVKCTRINS